MNLLWDAHRDYAMGAQ